MPARYQEYGRRWAELNPGWEVRDWTRDTLPQLINQAVFDDIETVRGDEELNPVSVATQQADVAGYELIYQFGGIYVNCDLEPVRSIEEHLLPRVDQDAYAGFEDETYLVNAAIGGPAKHPFWLACIERLPGRYWPNRRGQMNEITGPHLLTATWRELNPRDFTALSRETFNPVHFHQVPEGGFAKFDVRRLHPDTIAVHHWGHRALPRPNQVAERRSKAELMVVFTATERPEYLRDTIATWRRVRGIDDVAVRIHLEPTARTVEMRDLITELWPEVEIRENEHRLGVLSNPWRALATAFEEASFVVLAEDDVQVSSDVLEYMAWARDEFRDDPEVLAVCAYDTHLESEGHEFGLGDVTKQRWFSPLVWGTWEDRWISRLRDTWDHDYSQMGWDWNVRNGVMGQELVCVFPRRSRSTHIGQFGGTHLPPNQFAETQAGTFVSEREPCGYELKGYLSSGLLS